MSETLPVSLESQQVTQLTSEQSSELHHAILTPHIQMEEESSSSTPIQTGNESPTPKRKRRFTPYEAATQTFLQLEEKKMKLIYEENEENEKNTEKSEDYHFFMSLIPHMAQFNSLQKLQVRGKILQLIIDMASSLGSLSHGTSRSGF
jgi:hypothetical protein